MTERSVRVLLTGGGGAGTIEIIKSLHGYGTYEVIAADASPHSVGCLLADRGYQIPWGIDPSFEGVLRDLIARERPDFVVPLVDEEIGIVHRLVDREFAGQVRVLAPRLEFCEAMLDKWRMAELLEQAGLPVARTWLATDAEAASYPAVVKPRTGRGSRDVAYLTGPDELEHYLQAAREPRDRYIVQERVLGVEYTTSAVVGLDGELLAVVPKEAAVKRGITQVGVTRVVPEIDALARGVQERLRADGPFNIQLIMGDDRVPKVIEINPRYSTTVALTLGAGLDEVHAVIQRALGRDVGPLSFEPDLMMIRYNAQIYVKESEWRERMVDLEGSR